jgi:predicted nucleic acid-binding protein
MTTAIGIDTGFFVGLMKGDTKPIEFWASLVDGDTLPVISMLTLGELLYISFRIGQPDKGKELVDSIDKSARVMPVDRPIVEKAASLKAGRGIPYIDSIILSTFMLTGCREIHTTDRNHFSEIKIKGLSFVFY